MGTLYRNGIPYVGSGGAGGVEVTQAEYDALPTSEKMNGSIYFITDGSVSYPTASQMRYDNTESGIPSTSVQGAIDELKIDVDDLNNGLTYQLFTSFVGSQVVNLPAEFNELYIFASYQGGATVYNRTSYLIKNALSDSYQYYYSGDSGGRISVHINKSAIDTIEYYDGSTDRTSQTTFTIYYR